MKYKISRLIKKQSTLFFFVLILTIVPLLFILNQEKIKHEDVRLDFDDKKYLIDISRLTMEQYLTKGVKYEVGRIPSKFLANNTVIISLYLDGKILGLGKSQRSNLLDSAIEATINALGDKKYNTIKTNEIEKVVVIINIIIYRQELENKDVVFLTENFDTGLEGVYLQGSGLDFFLSPQFAVENNMNIVQMLQSLCLRTNLKTDCWGSKDIKIYKFDSINFMGKGANTVDFYRAAPLVMQNSINKDEIYKSIVEAADWQLRMQKNNGAYEYFFNPASGYYSKNNNIIRQALAAYSMAKAYQLTGNTDYLGSAERNINFILTHLREENNIAYLQFDNISNLGSAAVTMIAMLELPNYRKYDREINLLSNFLLSMQREDGSFITYYNSNQPDDFDFYPGETMLALVRLYKKTNDKRYLDAVEKGFLFYRKYFDRTKHEAFIMWQISTFYETYEITKKQEYADFVFEMADWIMDQQYDEKNTPYSDFLGGFSDFLGGFRGNGGVPTLSSAVYADGIADAYKLAKIVNDGNKVKKYGKSLRLASRFILQLQFDDVNTYYTQNPENAVGAIRESLISNNLRIDYTSHSVLALLKIYNVYTEIKDTYV